MAIPIDREKAIAAARELADENRNDDGSGPGEAIDDLIRLLEAAEAYVAAREAEMAETKEGVVGWIVIRVPLVEDGSNGTFEEPPEAWLTYGEAELISHNLDQHALGWLSTEIDYGDIMANFEMPKALRDQADAALEAGLALRSTPPKGATPIGQNDQEDH